MLSRVAENIYWLARYVERAENVARMVAVNHHLTLDAPIEGAKQWQPLIQIMADEEPFKKRFGTPEERNVLKFLVCDGDNPNSIFSCLRAARENCRCVREIIPTEMWLQINTLYLRMKEAAARGADCATEELLSHIRLGNHLFFGLMDDTMSHGEAFHFARLGRLVERADKTSRVLDVKYFILVPDAGDVSGQFDSIQWMAVLKSVSAYEMYWKKMGRIEPMRVIEFLLFDDEFPRSVRFCIEQAREELERIVTAASDPVAQVALDQLTQLRQDLSAISMEQIARRGLHRFIDDLQNGLNILDGQIYQAFFSMKPTHTPMPVSSLAE